MRALYDFIIKPLGETYDNKIKIDKKELILNTKDIASIEQISGAEDELLVF